MKIVTPEIRNIKDIRQELRIYRGALTSFQNQLYHVVGVVEEIRSLVDEVLCDIRSMDEDLTKLKKEAKKL